MDVVTTTLHSPEQRVLLDNISWEIYDKGQLEIMSPSSGHEHLKEKIALLVNIVAEEMGINAHGAGSTTFRRKDLQRGFEPDSCFYLENFKQVLGKKEIDLIVDPPPDLVIEIDITGSSLNKLAIIAAVGVPEVWHYRKDGWRILKLQGTDYKEDPESSAFGGLTSEAVNSLLEQSLRLEPLAWIRRVREWIRTRP